MPKQKTPSTVAFYARKYDQLAAQARERFGIHSGAFVAPIHVVDHLIARRPHISKRTWAVYKAAILNHIDHALPTLEGEELVQSYRVAAEQLRDETQTEAMPRGRQGSSLKSKRVRMEQHQTLMQYMKDHYSRHRYAAATHLWCQATQLTGLRPGEWLGATLVRLEGSDGPINALMVPNAKATNGRGNGEFRHLLLSHLNDDEMEVIERQLAQILHMASLEGGFEEQQKNISDYLLRAGKKAFPKKNPHLTLYSYRHQFSADAKAEMNKSEVAALMGHGSDQTASRNYARASVAQGRSKVNPLPTEVARVRSVARPRLKAPKS